jgi:hypothetical protein
MSIPRTLHFCWIGPHLVWAHGVALPSAAAQSGIDEIILHHKDELAEAGVKCQRLTPESLLAPAPARLDFGLGEALTRLYARLSSPVRTKPYVAVINPDYVPAHRQTQLYNPLVDAVIPGLFRLDHGTR